MRKKKRSLPWAQMDFVEYVPRLLGCRTITSLFLPLAEYQAKVASGNREIVLYLNHTTELTEVLFNNNDK